MRHLHLLLRLQRMIDGEIPGAGFDDLAELEEIDAEAETASGPESPEGLEDLWPLEEDETMDLDDLDREMELDLDGMEEDLLETEPGEDSAPKGRRGPADGPLARLLKGVGSRRQRDRAPAGKRRRGPLQRLIESAGRLEDPEAEPGRIAELLSAGSRSRTARIASADPVVARRRQQIRDFMSAWREARRSVPSAQAGGLDPLATPPPAPRGAGRADGANGATSAAEADGTDAAQGSTVEPAANHAAPSPVVELRSDLAEELPDGPRARGKSDEAAAPARKSGKGRRGGGGAEE